MNPEGLKTWFVIQYEHGKHGWKDVNAIRFTTVERAVAYFERERKWPGPMRNDAIRIARRDIVDTEVWPLKEEEK